MPVHTGVRVIYADDESFTVMTPEGHPESGWNTFSAYADEDGTTVAQIQSLARANDPIYEIGFRVVGATEQERIWTHVLKSLSGHFGVNEPVSLEKACVDPKVQWSQIQEPLAQRGRPLDDLHDDRPAALAPRPIAKVNESAARWATRGRIGAMSGSTYDAVVVGAGPNGLAAAVELARNGRSGGRAGGRRTRSGGGARSAEITLPGFVHDLGSAIHPLGYASPFFAHLPLEEHGLEWIHPPAPLAHPFDDGTAAVLERSTERTGATLGPRRRGLPQA